MEENIKESLAEANRRSADLTMAFEMLGEFTDLLDVDVVYDKIIMLFKQFFAPKYIKFINLETDLNEIDLIKKNKKDYYWDSEENTLLIRFRYAETLLGIIKLTELAFPGNINRYLNTIMIISKICSLRINNARHYNELNLEKQKLKESEEQLKRSEEASKQAFKQADFYKDLFAHDISNILTIIQGFADLYSLEEDLGKKEEMINKIKTQVQRAIKLISDVRTISKLEEKSEIVIKNVKIHDILTTAIINANRGAHDRIIDIGVENFDKELSAKGNELLLVAFENILSNAIKYCDESIIIVKIRVSTEIKNTTNFIKIEFIDNGVGISDEKKTLLFMKGFRKEKESKGMGFGLTLVNKIINSYNGEIQVRNNIEGDHTKGTNFIVMIPKA